VLIIYNGVLVVCLGQDAAVCLVIVRITSQKLQNHKILNEIPAKCLSNPAHLGLDQVLGECACGWEIALSVCGGFSIVNNVIHTAYIYICIMSLMVNAGYPRRNVPDFGRVFLMLKYTDITQNTYIQS